MNNATRIMEVGPGFNLTKKRVVEEHKNAKKFAKEQIEAAKEKRARRAAKRSAK